MAAVLDDLAQLVVQRLDRVGRVDHPAQLGRERQERDEPLPGVARRWRPCWGTSGPARSLRTSSSSTRAASASAACRSVAARPPRPCGPCSSRTASRPGSGAPRRSARWPAVQVASIASANPVSPSQQTMSTSRMPRLASSAQTPAQNFAPSLVWTQMPSTCLMPSMSTPDRDVGGLVAHVGAVADLDHQRVEVDHRVERLQRAALPGQHLIEDLVGDLADRLVGELGADRDGEVVLDVADRHPARVQADDHLVEPTEPARALRDQPRPERALPIPRDVQRHVADLGGHRLR